MYVDTYNILYVDTLIMDGHLVYCVLVFIVVYLFSPMYSYLIYLYIVVLCV